MMAFTHAQLWRAGFYRFSWTACRVLS